jgi:two-component sensor histidine kinase
MTSPSPVGRQVERLLLREKALATFGTFAFSETNLGTILSEAARVCAECLDVPFSKVCRYQPAENDLLVVAGYGWQSGVVGYAISVADETSPQGRAFATGQPQVCPNVAEANTYTLPAFYPAHGILSTVDVLVAAKSGLPFGVLEVDSQVHDAFDAHDIDFLTGFANILAEAVATSERSETLKQTIANMETLIADKELLSQELKHRVRNNLHLVYGLLTSQVAAEHNQDSINAFRSIALRVMGLAEVFEHLLGVGMNKTISFGDYVTALCANLPELYKDQDVTLTCSADVMYLELDAATALGIVITELVSNAYLHAFPARSGEINVTVRVSPGAAVLTVSDNGIGFVEIETKRRGVGLVRRLVDQAGATMSLHSDKGSTWTIELAVPEVAPLLMA